MYRIAIRHRYSDAESIDEAQAYLAESINFAGSYRCGYEEFKDIYRVNARRLGRLKKRSFICQLSLVSERYDLLLETEQKNAHLKIAEEGLTYMLRQGDVFTRSTSTQFLLLLNDISRDDAGSIMTRLKDYFSSNRTDDGYDVEFAIRDVEPSEYRPGSED